MGHWLEEDSLAVVAYLSVCGPWLQGHASWVKPLRLKQLTYVRRQQDVHAAKSAHFLPLHIERKAAVSTNAPHIGRAAHILICKLLCTCKWGPGHWRSSPCACGAAGNGFLSRTSAGWSNHSSLCEESPQSFSPVHPHPLFWPFSELLYLLPGAPQSLLQSYKNLFEVERPKAWTQMLPVLSSWSEQVVSVTLIHSFQDLFSCSTSDLKEPWMCVLLFFFVFWWTDRRWWFIHQSVRVQEKDNRARLATQNRETPAGQQKCL